MGGCVCTPRLAAARRAQRLNRARLGFARRCSQKPAAGEDVQTVPSPIPVPVPLGHPAGWQGWRKPRPGPHQGQPPLHMAMWECIEKRSM